MTVRLLNNGQKKAIEKAAFAPDIYFNPIQDADGNWIISNEEVEGCMETGKFPWIKNLPEITYNKIPDAID